jgi:hypothetical protein
MEAMTVGTATLWNHNVYPHRIYVDKTRLLEAVPSGSGFFVWEYGAMKEATRPPIVRAAEDLAEQIKKLHAAIEKSDRDNLKKAIQLGKMLTQEREKFPARSKDPEKSWSAHLKTLGIPQQRAWEYMEVYKQTVSDGLLPEPGNKGFSEAVALIREGRRKEKEAKAAVAEAEAEAYRRRRPRRGRKSREPAKPEVYLFPTPDKEEGDQGDGSPNEAGSEEGEAGDSSKVKRQGVGVMLAHEAINCLKRIPPNDAFLVRAFQIVMDWLRHNRPAVQHEEEE